MIYIFQIKEQNYSGDAKTPKSFKQSWFQLKNVIQILMQDIYRLSNTKIISKKFNLTFKKIAAMVYVVKKKSLFIYKNYIDKKL